MTVAPGPRVPPPVLGARTRLGAVIVIAKAPIPGRVKTRLVPPLTHDEAAAVAGAALGDTLRAAGQVDADEWVLAFEGSSAGWAPDGWRVTPQPAGGLDVRLAAAFRAVPRGPAVLVGMDTPQLLPGHVHAFDYRKFDACLGLAADGGFWAIGFTDPSVASAAISGVPMSTAHTGADQLERLTRLGLNVQLLDVLCDVDTIETADEVAALAPDTDFAAALRATRARRP